MSDPAQGPSGSQPEGAGSTVNPEEEAQGAVTVAHLHVRLFAELAEDALQREAAA